MAQQPPLLQVPQHVSAQLSHLMSRPGVQSTLILSRRDGSIIQATGQLAAGVSGSQSPGIRAPVPENPPRPSSSSREPDTTVTTADEQQQQDLAASSATIAPQTPYIPSHAEILAAHIFALVSTASALGTSLSSPGGGTDKSEADYGGAGAQPSPYAGANGNRETKEHLANGTEGGHEREEDDELKLLRVRTKIHEVIVIPDRRFLLCVVHDVTATSSTGGR